MPLRHTEGALERNCYEQCVGAEGFGSRNTGAFRSWGGQNTPDRKRDRRMRIAMLEQCDEEASHAEVSGRGYWSFSVSY